VMSHIIRPKRSALAVSFNNTVFSFGIVLIKLWFGRPFQDLPESMGLVEGLGLTVSIKTYRTACSLLPRIHEEAGYMYWIAGMRSHHRLVPTSTDCSLSTSLYCGPGLSMCSRYPRNLRVKEPILYMGDSVLGRNYAAYVKSRRLDY
jgi:hypothetical protein